MPPKGRIIQTLFTTQTGANTRIISYLYIRTKSSVYHVWKTAGDKTDNNSQAEEETGWIAELSLFYLSLQHWLSTMSPEPDLV